MVLEIKVTDNGVNDPICSRQGGSRSAGNGVRHFRSSASENLTTLQIGRKNKALKIVCWNVRTMYEVGKLKYVKSETSRLHINILGLCETRWTNQSDFYGGDFRIIHSGATEQQRGVAVVLDKWAAKAVDKVIYEGDRLMLVKYRGKPTDVVILQIYMPTSEAEEELVDAMYEKVEEFLDTETKGKDYMVIMGDWNAVVGEGKEDKCIGHYGLGWRNNRGENFVKFCKRRNLYVANTWFCQDKRRRYTW